MRPTTGGPLSVESINTLPGQWRYEPKVNGWRALVHVPTLTCFNRHGELLSITHEFEDSLTHLWQTAPLDVEWLDCEVLSRRHGINKGGIIVLDIVSDVYFYEVRRDWMSTLWPTIDLGTGIPDLPVSILPDTTNPFEMWDELQQENERIGCDFYEGIVGKRIGTHYEMQLVSASRTTPHWIKYRFDQYTEL